MTIGIAGLGLIGGSLAKAYKAAGDHTVFAHDIDTSVIELAKLSGAVDDALTEDNLSQCDLILVALYTSAAIEYIERIAPFVSKDCVVVDCCGTKERVCRAGFETAEKYGFTFAGGHPMAGTQYSGFKYSRANLFKGASMIIVPSRFDDIHLTQKIKDLLMPAGFGRMTVTTAKEHDRMIAFTSQLPHVVSNAFIKSPTAQEHKGFSAGSYKDLTRVAWLNENMWTELFFEDKEYLLYEIETVIASLEEYRDALIHDDREKMVSILREGRIAKEKVDKR